jgi:hypothetical protein
MNTEAEEEKFLGFSTGDISHDEIAIVIDHAEKEYLRRATLQETNFS